MSGANTNLRVRVLRARRIEANTLLIKRIRREHKGHSSLLKKFRELRHEFRELRHSINELRDEVRQDKAHLENEIHELQVAVDSLQEQISSGQPNNPTLQSLFNSKLGQVVTVTVGSSTLTGTVTVVGTNAVELTESSGDVLIIPYSHISAVQ